MQFQILILVGSIVSLPAPPKSNAATELSLQENEDGPSFLPTGNLSRDPPGVAKIVKLEPKSTTTNENGEMRRGPPVDAKFVKNHIS